MKAKTPTQSAAAAAYHALQDTIDTIRGIQRDVARDIVALEASGATPEPPTLSDEYSQPDRELINGAAYRALPPANASNILLFQKLRRAEQLKITLGEAEKQIFNAQIDLSREVLAEQDAAIRADHRERALLLVRLFAVNASLEARREKMLRAGAVVGHALDGWTNKFFGTAAPPTPMNDAPRRYLAEIVRLGILTEKDLET
jgi:hypothetical protein